VNGAIHDYGEATLGLKIGSDLAKVRGFMEGYYAQGFHNQGYGGRAGARFASDRRGVPAIGSTAYMQRRNV
jgi:hypothetical protein